MPRKKGTPNKKPKEERFNDRYYVNSTTGCWITTSGTYNYILIGNKKVSMRSAAWYFKYGEFPQYDLRNKCKNLACINPDHFILCDPKELFLSRVNKTDTCWIWTGKKDNKGYGIVSLLGFNKAHRLSWYFYRGEIPDGLLVCHHCDVTSCVNPDHLFLGTYKDNNLDKVMKNRQRGPVGIKNSSAKLSDIKVRAIRFLYDSDEFSTYDLEKIFDVSRVTISRTIKRRLWKHVAEGVSGYEA
jgi:hypothetical protein